MVRFLGCGISVGANPERGEQGGIVPYPERDRKEKMRAPEVTPQADVRIMRVVLTATEVAAQRAGPRGHPFGQSAGQLHRRRAAGPHGDQRPRQRRQLRLVLRLAAKEVVLAQARSDGVALRCRTRGDPSETAVLSNRL